MRAALVENNIVTNVILVGDNYTPPEGTLLIPSETATIGDTYAGGEFSSPVQEPDPVKPIVVAASSAKLVLDDDGLYPTVEGICRNHPVTAVRIFWESANTWAEDNPYILAIGVELGLDDDGIHAMFVRAQQK